MLFFKIRTFFLGLSIVLFLSIISNCTNYKFVPKPCFKQDVYPIFITNCTMSGCHDSKQSAEGYDFTTYDGIMKGVKPKQPLFSEVYKVIKGNHPSMPPQKPLSTEQVQIIRAWIDDGAQNTSNCNTGCDTLKVSYAKNVTEILNKWCVGCHNASNSQGSIDLSTYNTIVNSISNNKLLGSIKHTNGISPMPKNGSKLTDCEIRQIEQWIQQGYPQN